VGILKEVTRVALLKRAWGKRHIAISFLLLRRDSDVGVLVTFTTPTLPPYAASLTPGGVLSHITAHLAKKGWSVTDTEP
jgi:hypothetical protein